MSRQRERETSTKEGKEMLTPSHSHCEVLLHEAAVAEQPSPQLHPNDAKDEEDKEAEKKDVPQHRQGVQEQVHKDAHACRRREPEGASVGHSDRQRERGREGEEKERSLQDKQEKSPMKIKAARQKLTTVQTRPDLRLLPFLVLTSTNRQPAELL